jgi:predicted alpha/beta superfamily hydrolase
MKRHHFSVTLLLLLTGISRQSQAQDAIPAHDSIKISSVLLAEVRTINVWTPPGYAQSTVAYPVMYMPDGGIKEDFPHIANTMSDLIQKGSIPPMILVGIENTQRRRDLTGPTDVKKDKKIAPVVGGSEKFRAFISEELFPEINKRYRTTDEKGIIGESAAGLFIVETFFLKPEMFDYYIAMDPSLWWNNHELVRHAKDYLAKMPTTEKRFWFAGSDEKGISKHTKELAAILESEKQAQIIWKYSPEPNEQHSTIYRATKEKALIWIFN